MVVYDYKKNIVEDVKEYVWDNYTKEEIENIIQNENDEQEALYDDLWTADSVTGNGSGSYTFNTWQAEEFLCHNMDLLKEALEEFGCDITYLERGAEACDVTIRCYLLSGAMSEAIEEIEKEL